MSSGRIHLSPEPTCAACEPYWGGSRNRNRPLWAPAIMSGLFWTTTPFSLTGAGKLAPRTSVPHIAGWLMLPMFLEPITQEGAWQQLPKVTLDTPSPTCLQPPSPVPHPPATSHMTVTHGATSWLLAHAKTAVLGQTGMPEKSFGDKTATSGKN